MNDQIDESIPLLTEIISAPDNASVMAKTQTVSPIPLAAETNLFSAVSTPSDLMESATDANEKSKNISAEEWAQLEQTVRENVLRQVLSRVDFVLEHRVSDSLADVLQTAVDRLADDIRAGLRQSIEEVVTRALTQEISKIKSTMR
ncbi:MAG: hypothetical protein ACEQSE_00040 [Candidatus Aquirickettsiella gammari]